MHRAKKLAVAMTAALLIAAGVSSAMAASSKGSDNEKVTICHSTGSRTHPFHKITVSENAADAHMTDHAGRDARPDSNGNCPTAPSDGEDHAVTVCHFENGVFEPLHFEEGDNSWDVHLDHNDDEIAEDDSDNHLCPTTPPPAEENENENCSVESSSGDPDAGHDGLVIAGNLDVDAANSLENVLCRSEILDYLTLSVLGHSTGNTVLEGGLLGGLGGVLTNLLDADASLLASLVVIL